MKNKILIDLTVTAWILFMVSCADTDKGDAVKSPVDSTEKKAAHINKSKKKEKKKIVTLNKKKPPTTITADAAGMITTSAPIENSTMLNQLAGKINEYAVMNGYSTKICFLVDMSLSSGRNRFFVYDFEKKSIISAALVAHGCCNKSFMSHPKFSNAPDCGCTSVGKYKVGEFFHGTYGKSFRLYGMDNSNSNAFRRGVVIHGHDCVPDGEIYPRVLCNSFGCVMVSNNFFDKLSGIIRKSDKPIVLWVYG